MRAVIQVTAVLIGIALVLAVGKKFMDSIDGTKVPTVQVQQNNGM